jgi:hypothetical protein
LFSAIVVVEKLGTYSFTKQVILQTPDATFFFLFELWKKTLSSFVEVIGYHILQRREMD